jgi:FkbM family methyltransferase
MLRGVLPHAFVEAVRDRRMLVRLGAADTRSRNASLAREARLDLLPPEALRTLETVVDVGANEGRWSAAVVLLARPRRLIAIEPSPAVIPLLRQSVESSPGVTIVAAAVGETIGNVTLNLTAHSHNSSLLPPRSMAMDAVYGGGYAVQSQVTVALTTLDELTRELDQISLLKIDAQGYERSVLKGASETLRKTRWLLIEANFRSHYEEDVLFPDLHSHLVECGFTLTGLSPAFVRDGVALWCDCLYSRN